MVVEMIVRFALGGALVWLFSLIGEAFETKTFSGLFGAAPSVAIATLGLALGKKGAEYVGTEARMMAFACVALFAYTSACALIAQKKGMPVWLGAALSYAVWLALALGPYAIARKAGLFG
ncbi:MAG: hypothetical protein JWP97_1585 [Labilithrix sp.]|nr:hypothetical protein [Labilithrix sp.]